MFEIIQSEIFSRWLNKLRDRKAIARINARLRRVSLGNLGDTKTIGDGVSEMRLAYGPGYRLYFIKEGHAVIVMLAGGSKATQKRDIAKAKEIAKEWRS